MKTSDVEFQFPVLGFTADQEFLGFRDRKVLTACGPLTAKGNLEVGTEFVDADLRRWVVRSMLTIRNARPWFLRPLAHVLGVRLYRVEHELEVLEPISLDEVKQRIHRWMVANPPEWSPHDDLDTVIATNFADLGEASSIAEIYERFQPDTFEPL